MYKNKVKNCFTYLVTFWGIKNSKKQALQRISFGGNSKTAKETYIDAMEFIKRVSTYEEAKKFEYILNKPDIVEEESKTGDCSDTEINSEIA